MRDRYVVVADTNILLQSLLNDSGPAAKCLGYFRRGEIDLAVSRDTINEAKDVLSRSSLRNRYSQSNAFIRFPSLSWNVFPKSEALV